MFTYKKSVNIEYLACEVATQLTCVGNTYALSGVGIESSLALAARPALAHILFKEWTGLVAGFVEFRLQFLEFCNHTVQPEAIAEFTWA
jgi:hypothetical protein